jgi:hypothetical protein
MAALAVSLALLAIPTVQTFSFAPSPLLGATLFHGRGASVARPLAGTVMRRGKRLRQVPALAMTGVDAVVDELIDLTKPGLEVLSLSLSLSLSL